MYALRRGLGDDSALPKYFGMTVDCSNPLVWGVFSYLCGQYSPEAWRQMRAFQSPPAPPAIPAVSAGTSTVPAPYRCAGGSLVTAASNCPEFSAAVTAASQDQVAAEGDALRQWAAEQVPVSDESDKSGGGLGLLGWLAVGAVGVVVVVAIGGGSRRR